MQHLPQGVKDKEGCFVYIYQGPQQINVIAVRDKPDVSDECSTDLKFRKGELVSIDLIRHNREPGCSDNGPFLRLSDGSGWLFEKKYGMDAMKVISVEEGLWRFYVDNVPTGIALRRHPVDRMDVRVLEVVYQPMQKIYCDRKVTHPDTGIHYYRVQGTNGWVFDRRPIKDAKTAGRDTNYMLMDKSKIATGYFIYQNMDDNPINIRKSPDIGNNSRSDLAVQPNELVSVDVIRHSPFVQSKNGPFLRLTDGSGWLFEHKLGKCIMQQVPVGQGEWRFRALNEPVGIGLRRQPIDSQEFWDGNTIYKPGDIIECTHMVCSTSNRSDTDEEIDEIVHFYRVKGTNGWVFDKRNGTSLLQLLSNESPHSPRSVIASEADESDFIRHDTDSISTTVMNDEISWTPDFVRGIAVTIDNVNEIPFNRTSKVISFQNTAEDSRINVYYTTRTVGTSLNHPHQGLTQMFRRNCSTKELVRILQNPRCHTGKGYQRRLTSHEASNNRDNKRIVKEDELRNNLCSVEKEIAALQENRDELLKQVRDIDLQNSKEQLNYKQQYELREKESDIRAAQRQQQKEREEQQFRARTCFICQRVFVNQHAKIQHHNAVHAIRCDVCGRNFNCLNAMENHKYALDHW